MTLPIDPVAPGAPPQPAPGDDFRILSSLPSDKEARRIALEAFKARQEYAIEADRQAAALKLAADKHQREIAEQEAAARRKAEEHAQSIEKQRLELEFRRAEYEREQSLARADQDRIDADHRRKLEAEEAVHSRHMERRELFFDKGLRLLGVAGGVSIAVFGILTGKEVAASGGDWRVAIAIGCTTVVWMGSILVLGKVLPKKSDSPPTVAGQPASS
ncbi:MAG TPA: hypothetical protein VH092_28740 [Urbifossiella sp.]|jgi:hypothetical protein|nr:hypothetical protein [Urbifossiella sp.]